MHLRVRHNGLSASVGGSKYPSLSKSFDREGNESSHTRSRKHSSLVNYSTIEIYHIIVLGIIRHSDPAGIRDVSYTCLGNHALESHVHSQSHRLKRPDPYKLSSL